MLSAPAVKSKTITLCVPRRNRKRRVSASTMSRISLPHVADVALGCRADVDAISRDCPGFVAAVSLPTFHAFVDAGEAA